MNLHPPSVSLPAAAMRRDVSWTLLALLLFALALPGRHEAWPVLLMLVVAPLLEELTFRAGLQEALHRRGWPPLAAVCAVTLAFALAHALTRSWLLGAAVLLPSLLLGLLYARTRRIAPVVMLHSVMNLIWLVSSTWWIRPPLSTFS